MLETLISSRIRRTLFEYLLSHPTQYFYLRGLAKDLHLSISPLRRELMRLEQAGVLAVVQEANIRFYRVNTESPVYRQLRQAFQPTPAPKPPVALELVPHRDSALTAPSLPIEFPSPVEPPGQPAPAPAPRPRSPLQGPALVGAAVVGMVLMVIVASLFYFSMTNDRLASTVRRALATQKAEVTVIAPAPSSASGLPAAAGAAQAGVMRGSRWQIVPGGFGGFSSGASIESY